ncbi:MAG: glutaredoxin family protein [Pseudomonadota bacterium]
MANKPMLYALSTCSHCRRAKEFLDECQVDYDLIDVDLCQGEKRQTVIDEVKKYNPRLTFPTLVIGEVVIVGFKRDEIAKALDSE